MRKYFWLFVLVCCQWAVGRQEQSNSYTAMDFLAAVKDGNLKKVKSFPHNYVNTIDSTGFYPLSLAIRNKRPDLVEVLLSQGADPNLINADNLRTTPLMQCSNVNSTGMARMLIKNGGDINILDKNGDPVIHWAAYYGQLELAQLLLDHRAKTDVVSIHSSGALQVALKEWKSDMVSLLLENGITHNPVEKKHLSLLKAIKDNDLDYLKNHISVENSKLVDASGTPILVTAAELGHLEAVKLLLSKQAHINAINPSGHTALNRAIYFDKTKVIAYLLEKGADVNKTDERFVLPPLVAAAIKNKAVVGKELIALGADINVVDKINTFSPLTWAVVYGNKEFVEMIMKHKPNLDIVTTYGTKVVEMTTDEQILSLLKSVH